LHCSCTTPGLFPVLRFQGITFFFFSLCSNRPPPPPPLIPYLNLSRPTAQSIVIVTPQTLSPAPRSIFFVIPCPVVDKRCPGSDLVCDKWGVRRHHGVVFLRGGCPRIFSPRHILTRLVDRTVAMSSPRRNSTPTVANAAARPSPASTVWCTSTAPSIARIRYENEGNRTLAGIQADT
jgi:hypothetical protein